MHPVPDLSLIKARLLEIFPEGLEDRIYCVRDMAVSTIFVMFYLDTVEGAERYMRPSQVTLMSDTQAEKLDDEARREFAHATTTRKKGEALVPPLDRWYRENTREPIRDETLGDGLMKYGAVRALPVPPTSDRARYYLTADFAGLFLVPDESFLDATKQWRQTHLSADALRRISLLKHITVAKEGAVMVQFPGGGGQFQMSPGESSVLTSQFIEKFSTHFMTDPVVLFISESGNKATKYLSDRAKALRLHIDIATLLPDVILVDMGCVPMRIVFAEIVVSDGPIRADRKEELLKLAASAEILPKDCNFVTVFSHRDSAPFKKAVNSLAWGSFAWFANEPDKLLIFEELPRRLKERVQ